MYDLIHFFDIGPRRRTLHIYVGVLITWVLYRQISGAACIRNQLAIIFSEQAQYLGVKMAPEQWKSKQAYNHVMEHFRFPATVIKPSTEENKYFVPSTMEAEVLPDCSIWSIGDAIVRLAGATVAYTYLRYVVTGEDTALQDFVCALLVLKIQSGRSKWTDDIRIQTIVDQSCEFLFPDGAPKTIEELEVRWNHFRSAKSGAFENHKEKLAEWSFCVATALTAAGGALTKKMRRRFAHYVDQDCGKLMDMGHMMNAILEAYQRQRPLAFS